MPQAARPRIWLTLGAGALALTAGLSATPAQAQFYFDTWGGTFHERWDDVEPRYREARPLDRADIRAILGRRGYEIAAPMARNNDVYIVQVVDPAGRRLRLIVDAFDGTILRRFEANVGAAPPPPPPPGRDFEDDYFEAPARPPRGVPGERYSRPQIEPDVAPEITPGRERPRPEPRKATPARAEPKPAAPKPPAAQTKAPETAKPAETKQIEAKPAETKPSDRQEAAKPAPAPAKPEVKQQAEATPPKPEEKPQASAGPRVIPLYKKPEEAPAGAAAAEAQK